MTESQRDQTVDIFSYNCVVWDFDGTLFDLGIDWSALKKRLHTLLQSYPDYSPPQPHSIDGLVAEARRLSVTQVVFEAIIAAENEALQRWDNGLKRIPVDIFLHLKDKSVIVTNNMSPTIRDFLERISAQNVAFISRDQVRQPKPSPEGLLILKGHWEGKKAVLVGDSQIDRQLAHSCGMPFMDIQDLVKQYPHGLHRSTHQGHS